jgi:hypothetical protein
LVDPEDPDRTCSDFSHSDPDTIASYAAASGSSPLVFPPGRSWSGWYAAVHVEEDVCHALAFAAAKGVSDGNKTYNACFAAEEHTQCQWLQVIISNPFRPATFDARWRTSTAVAIAKQLYESRDFSPMPVLADALQDGGCTNEDILNHCRDASATHVRGCWVVDLVLGKA